MEKDSLLPKRCQRLRELRGNKTQKEMSALLDVTEKTYRSWENGEYRKGHTEKTYPQPDLERLIKMSEIFHCSIDYLLCRSDCTSVDNHYISLKTGLSDKAIERITSKNGNTPNQDFLNSFILSEEYLEIEHNMFWIENNCHNIKLYYSVFENMKAAIETTENQEEYYRLDDKLQEYANHLEHNGNQILFLIYQCSLSFGNFLNKIRETWSKEINLTLKSLESPMPGLEKPKDNL